MLEWRSGEGVSVRAMRQPWALPHSGSCPKDGCALLLMSRKSFCSMHSARGRFSASGGGGLECNLVTGGEGGGWSMLSRAKGSDMGFHAKLQQYLLWHALVALQQAARVVCLDCYWFARQKLWHYSIGLPFLHTAIQTSITLPTNLALTSFNRLQRDQTNSQESIEDWKCSQPKVINRNSWSKTYTIHCRIELYSHCNRNLALT